MAVPQAPASAALGRYELIKESTASSIATTWLGRDPAEGGRAVSVLRLHRHVTKRQELVETFLSTVRAASALVHPNIARVLDSGQDAGEVFVVQELIEGDSLSGLLRAAGAEGLPTAAVLRIAKDVAAALDAAHAAGVAHGELGPWHVLLGSEGSVKVAGFGVAHALSRIGLHGLKSVDRLAYGAPERVKAMAQASTATGPVKGPDAAGDLFALGCVLWEAFTRERLFVSKMEAAVVQKVLTAAIEPVGKRIPGLPAEAEQVVDRCLERDPEKRLASAKEVLEILRRVDDQAAEDDELGALVEKLCGAAIRARREDARKPSIAPRAPAAPKPRTATLLGVTAAGMAEVLAAAQRLNSGASGAGDKGATPDEDSSRLSVSDLEEVSVDVDLDAETSVKGPPGRPPGPPPGRAVGAATPAPSKVTPAPTRAGAPVAPKKSTPPPMMPRRGATIMGMAPVKAPEAPPRKEPIDDEATNDLNDWVSAQEDSTDGTAGPGKGTPAPAPAEVAAPDAHAAGAPGAEPGKVGSEDETAPAPTPEGAATAPAKGTPAPSKVEEPDGAKFGPPAADPEPPHHQVVATMEPSRSKEPVGPIEQGAQLGSYEVLLPVARGGMASVWAGRTRGGSGIQGLVAIKTLLAELDDDPEFHKMFRDETRVASRIRHANVAALYAVGEHGETPYLVMEWVDGDTLAALLRAAKPLGGIPQGVVLRIASDTCAGLHAAHELKDDAGISLDVVHRDITPANVLLTTKGEVKVVDFGVAKSKAQLHVTRVGGVVKGKTPYLSPEQLGGLPLDRRSDLFSLGTMLYVLTTGLHPFRGDTDLKTLENIAIKKPVPLRSIVPWIDPAFETLVLKLLEKDPRQRLASAADVKAELDRILETLDEPCGNADVAAFQRKALGEPLDQRTRELEAAASTLDARRAGTAGASKVVIAIPSSPDPVEAATGSAALPAPAIESPAPGPANVLDVSFTADAARAKEIDLEAPPAAIATEVPAATAGGFDGMAEEPLDVALGRSEDTQRNKVLMLRRRRMAQLVGLVVAAGVVVIGAAAILSSDGEDPHGKPGPVETARTAKPVEPPPATTAEPPPPEVVTAEPTPTQEPPPAPSAEATPTAEPTPPTTTAKPPTAPPGPRPPAGRPPGPRPPPKKPPVYNPQGI